jgi:hypothetical protein
MWAEYNHSAYPIVEVNMKGTIQSDDEFNSFMNEWLELYERKRDFVFIFDTREVGWVDPRYALKMAGFITELKRRDRQYLKQSSIIVNSWFIKGLLKIIFYLESPVCPIDYHTNANSINTEYLLEIANRNLSVQKNLK